MSTDGILRLDMRGRVYSIRRSPTGLQVMQIEMTDDEVQQVAEAARAAQPNHISRGRG